MVLVLLITLIFGRYAQYGDVSPKIDVYAFGVVLFELISAKNAVLKTGESVAESKGLVALVCLVTPLLSKNTFKSMATCEKRCLKPKKKRLVSFKNGLLEMKLTLTCFVYQFEEALNQSDPLEGLRKLVDPRLGDNYPIDSVLKVKAFLLKEMLYIY